MNEPTAAHESDDSPQQSKGMPNIELRGTPNIPAITAVIQTELEQRRRLMEQYTGQPTTTTEWTTASALTWPDPTNPDTPPQ